MPGTSDTSHTPLTGDGAARHGIGEALVFLLGLVGVPAGGFAEGAEEESPHRRSGSPHSLEDDDERQRNRAHQ